MNVTRIFLIGFFSSLLLVNAQVNRSSAFVPPPNPPRYFIVVEKTAVAAPYDGAIRQAVFDLVYQGAGGEMADGSVIEIWTYGEDTATRGFAPEMLMPDNHLIVAQRASAYVRGVPSTGEGDMPQFAEHMRNLASVAFETTLFFVSSPETRLDGTTVDGEVNEILAVHAERMAEGRKPFITTFRVQDGALAGFSVSESALVPAVPPMPSSRVGAADKERMIADARAALKAAQDAKNKPAVEEVKQAEVQVTEAKSQIDLRKIPDDEREGAIILRGKPKPTPAPVEPPAEMIASTGEVKDVQTPLTDLNALESIATTAVAEPARVKAPAKTAPASENSKPVADAPPKIEVASTEHSTAEVISEEGMPASTNIAGSGADDVRPPTVPPAKFAVQPEAWFTAGGLLAAGLLFFVVAGVLIWISIRRARAAAGPSFITRSMNDRKNLRG